MISLILYSTAGCHLCESAELLLQGAQQAFSLSWRWQEIADSPLLMERYGVRIPVLADEYSGMEIDWPFDDTQLQSWLKQLAH